MLLRNNKCHIKQALEVLVLEEAKGFILENVYVAHKDSINY